MLRFVFALDDLGVLVIGHWTRVGISCTTCFRYPDGDQLKYTYCHQISHVYSFIHQSIC